MDAKEITDPLYRQRAIDYHCAVVSIPVGKRILVGRSCLVADGGETVPAVLIEIGGMSYGDRPDATMVIEARIASDFFLAAARLAWPGR